MLQLADGEAVKSLEFTNRVYLGDPINIVRLYNEMEVDELLVIDIDATTTGAGIDLDLLESMAAEAFMPMTYGGGIDSLQSARDVFDLGFEKVAIDALLHTSPREATEISQTYGAQALCAVVTVDANRSNGNAVGPTGSLVPLQEHLADCLSCGVGEIVVYSRDRDGMRCGYDLELLGRVAEVVNVPVVACGGAGSLEDLVAGLGAGASAVAAGALFSLYGPSDSVLISYLEEEDFLYLASGRVADSRHPPKCL